MSRCQPTPFSLKSLISLTVAPLVFTAFFAADAKKNLAQLPNPLPTFALPGSLPADTTIKLDGSNSMTVINEALKQRFEEKFPGTTVTLNSTGSTEALKALANGDIDLAAIGRPLTDAETSQGLTAIPISREKIAIIVGADNSFNQDLTAAQFAQIFRGDITNWSQVGGPDLPIRFIDRPDSSDTRQALSQYPVFKEAPFQSGSSAVRAEDDTAAIVQQLGSNGISYAIASQVLNQNNVRVLAMHGTLPDDPRYPYSQPRGYVYKGTPNPGVQAFLGFATSEPGQEVVQAAKDTEAAAVGAASAPNAVIAPSSEAVTSPSPEAVAIPSPTIAAPVTTEAIAAKPFPWWLLLIPLIGMPLLYWLMRGRQAAVPPVAAVGARQGRLILTPRNCKVAYAYWEVPEPEKATLRRQGGRKIMLRLYDVTDIPDMDQQIPHSVKQFDCDDQSQDLHVPIAVDDRDYVAELGYVTDEGHWLKLARSPHVRVPRCAPAAPGNFGKAATIAGGAALAAGGVALATGAVAATRTPSASPVEQSALLEHPRVILVPRNSKEAYAYWEIPTAYQQALRQAGGKLMLRIHEVSGGHDINKQDGHTVQEYACSASAPDLHVPIAESDRDYVADLGYWKDNRWQPLAQSAPVRVPAAPHAAANLQQSGASVATSVLGAGHNLADSISTTARAAVGAVGGVAAAASAAALAAQNRSSQPAVDPSQGTARQVKKFSAPPMNRECQIILVPRNAQEAYAYWDVSESYKTLLREQGGRNLMLRIHDATNIDIDSEAPHSTQEYVCQETDRDKHVSIPASDRDYIAELGYLTEDRRWLRLIRSFHVHVPSNP